LKVNSTLGGASFDDLLRMSSPMINKKLYCHARANLTKRMMVSNTMQLYYRKYIQGRNIY
jgi:hypothetical protein